MIVSPEVFVFVSYLTEDVIPLGVAPPGNSPNGRAVRRIAQCLRLVIQHSLLGQYRE